MRTTLNLLEDWYGSEMAHLYDPNGPPPGSGLLMCCPVWGKQYIDRLYRYTLPSILSPENFAALQHRCRMIFYTDRGSHARLLLALQEAELQPRGVEVYLRVIPDEVMGLLKPEYQAVYDPDKLNKYWLLGVIGNVGIQHSRRCGLAYHQLQPDHVYAHRYFPNMFNLARTHNGIAQTGISADLATAGPELDQWNKATLEHPVITIPDLDLGNLGWRHLHAQTRACLMNANTANDLPRSHFWIWQGKEKLTIHCPHMNAAYISASQCQKAKSRIPATIDAELPSFMPSTPHVPTLDDGMGFIELSDGGKQPQLDRVDFREFAMECLKKVRFGTKYDYYTDTPCEMPIKPNGHLEPGDWQDHGMTDTEIAQQFRWLRDGIAGLKQELAYEFIEKLAFNQ